MMDGRALRFAKLDRHHLENTPFFLCREIILRLYGPFRKPQNPRRNSATAKLSDDPAMPEL